MNSECLVGGIASAIRVIGVFYQLSMKVMKQDSYRKNAYNSTAVTLRIKILLLLANSGFFTKLGVSNCLGIFKLYNARSRHLTHRIHDQTRVLTRIRRASLCHMDKRSSRGINFAVFVPMLVVLQAINLN